METLKQTETIKKKSTLREYAEAAAIALLLALFIRTFVVQAFKIPSGSMKPARQRLIQTRRFLPKPMTVEEAVIELGSDGEDLVVYRDAASDKVNVLFRRKDGHLGLIEPEV